MYCPKCGGKNDEDATFCGDCGNPLLVPQQSYSPAQPQQSNPQTQPLTAQIPQTAVIGAILNFFFPGLGYWYLGYRKIIGIHPVLFLIVIWIVEAILAFLISIFFRFLPLLISLFLAYDAYVKATGKPGWINTERK